MLHIMIGITLITYRMKNTVHKKVIKTFLWETIPSKQKFCRKYLCL